MPFDPKQRVTRGLRKRVVRGLPGPLGLLVAGASVGYVGKKVADETERKPRRFAAMQRLVALSRKLDEVLQ